MLIEAVQQLVKGKASQRMTSGQMVWLCTIMLTASGLKLLLWSYCRTSGNKIVRAYAEVQFFLFPAYKQVLFFFQTSMSFTGLSFLG